MQFKNININIKHSLSFACIKGDTCIYKSPDGHITSRFTLSKYNYIIYVIMQALIDQQQTVEMQLQNSANVCTLSLNVIY